MRLPRFIPPTLSTAQAIAMTAITPSGEQGIMPQRNYVINLTGDDFGDTACTAVFDRLFAGGGIYPVKRCDYVSTCSQQVQSDLLINPMRDRVEAAIGATGYTLESSVRNSTC